jgi:GNAT superfamily N-acetyltransferase
MEPPMAGISVRAVGKDDWPGIVELFGERGACGGCWCMWPRVPRGGKLWEELKGAKNRESFRRLVKAGRVHAVMAFAGEVPVGWCSFGPRSTFPRLETVRALKREGAPDAWSVVCFYIHPRWRRRGVGILLLRAATEAAFAAGAAEIEGYPVPPRSAAPIPAAFAWTGVPAQFSAAGYRKLPRRAGRPIYVKRPAAR